MHRLTRFTAILVISTALATLAGSPASAQTPSGDWRSDVEGYARRILDKGLAPGIGIAVTLGDSVVYAAGFGVADKATGREVDESTAFYIASSTKALTATAVLLLVERGEIDLQAPVSRYLTALELRQPLSADSVSIEDLLTMTHGMMDGGPVVLRTAFTGVFTPELLVRVLGMYPPSESGRAFNYGNLGYNILGLVLDPDDGHGWKDVVRREVLKPLRMRETSGRVSDFETDEIAMPHEIDPDHSWQRVRLAKEDENMHAAGGHFASARDLGRFVAAHVADGVLDGERIFPPGVLASTHATHADQDREFGPFQRFGWGYGWDLGTFEGDTIVHRFGSFTGYRSHMSFMPSHEIGVVVLVNGGGPASPAADLMATFIYDRLIGKSDVAATYEGRLADLEVEVAEGLAGLADHRAERAARQVPLPHPLEAYAGIYENPALGRMEWRVVGDHLEVSWGVARSEAEVYAAAEDQLRVELTGGGEVIDFTFPDGGGPAESLEYNGFTMARVE